MQTAAANDVRFSAVWDSPIIAPLDGVARRWRVAGRRLIRLSRIPRLPTWGRVIPILIVGKPGLRFLHRQLAGVQLGMRRSVDKGRGEGEHGRSGQKVDGLFHGAGRTQNPETGSWASV
jgi:hypothetical protein